MKHRMAAIAVIAIFGGAYLAAGYINPYTGRISLSELVLQLSGSRGDLNPGFSMNELLSLAMRMVPEFVLEMYLGMALYRHFCTASVYVFSRYPKRLKWYFKEVSLLGLQVLECQAVLMLAVILASICKAHVQADAAGMFLLIYHFLLRSVWTFCMTLLVNLLSISFGSGLAFMAVMSGQAFLITLLGIMKKLGTVLPMDEDMGLLQWNPVAHMVLGWHGSELQALKTVLKSPYPGLDLNKSLLVYLFLCAAVVFAGAVLVKRHDLVVSVAEEGEV